MRNEHVLERRELGQQVVELKNEAEGPVAERVPPLRRQIVDPFAVQVYGPLVGMIECPEQV